MSDDDFTVEELEVLAAGIERLGTIDAYAALLTRTVTAYADEPLIATGHYGRLLRASADFCEQWQEFRATAFGALFDPSVISPEDPPDGGSEE